MNNYSHEAISKILAPAFGLWLRTQAERLEELQIEILGRNRQLLTGLIPKVFLASRGVVYRGLHLSQVQLESENIRINIGQVLKGNPLRLLEPIQVSVKLVLDETALGASLLSPLLSQALANLLLDWINLSSDFQLIRIVENSDISWQKAILDSDQLALVGTLRHSSQTYQLTLRSGLCLKNFQTLHLQPLQINTVPELINLNLPEFLLDLGSDVELKEIMLSPGQIVCSGQLTVRN